MKKTFQWIVASLLSASILVGGAFQANAQSPTVPQEAIDRANEREEDINKVYDSIFSSKKQDPTLVEFGSAESKSVPVALTRLENGKIAYLVNGEPFYPRGLEMGWWDVRVDDNGMSVGDGGNVGEHFKEVTNEEWTHYFADIKQMGFNTVQLMIYWKDWQPENPFAPNAPTGDAKYDWTFLDNVTDLADQQGLKTELVVFFHSQTDNIPKEMDNFWAYQFDTFEDEQGKWSMSMQWGFDSAKGKMASAEDARRMRSEGKGWGVENFLEYWHPDIYNEMTSALTALGNHFKDSDKIIGYQIGNEEGFNPNVDSGRDHNPYYTKMKERWMEENPNKKEIEFRASLVNHVWASLNNALRKGDPYKPTTTNIQSSAMEEAGWGLPGRPIAGNDGTQMDYYRSVDMVGPMFYTNGENKLNNLDLAFNKDGQGFAKGFPLLFPSEIGAYHQGGAVAKQVSAMTAARGGVGMGFYCYGELYNDFEANGTKLPKPTRGYQVALQSTLQDCEELLWSGMPVNESQAKGLFMKQKGITIDKGKPTLSVLEGLNGKIMGIMHFPGNSGTPNDTAERTVTASLKTPEAGMYKLTFHQTNGSVSVQRIESTQAGGEVDFTFTTTGNEATYIVAQKVDPNQPDQGELKEILLMSPPTKKVYKLGEEFSADGIVVHARYSDGTRVQIDPSKLQFEGFDSSTSGDKEITVSYKEGEKTVTAKFIIIVQKPKFDTNFVLYEEGSLGRLFDGKIQDGLAVDLRANDEDVKRMANGEMYIEYTFDDLVSLKGVELWSNYGNGQGVTSLKVAVLSEDGTTWNFTSENPYNLTWPSNELQANKIEFEPVKTTAVRLYILSANNEWDHPNFGKKFAMFEVGLNQEAIPLESIEVTKLPNQLEYTLFGTLNTEGMQVMANYQDGTKRDITKEVVVSALESLTPGKKTVTVSYNDKTATFEVEVVVTLASITVVPPTKTVYTIGEPFDPTGMVVTASYDYGSSKDVTSEAKVTGFDSQSVGEKTITVTYQDKTAQFTVQVKEKAATLNQITVTPPTKKVYKLGEPFSAEGMKVMAVYSDNSQKDVTKEAKVTGFDSQSVGEKTITVTYQGKTAQFTITVQPEKPPVLVQGNNSSWTTGGSELTFKSDADFNSFVSVQVNGQTVDPKYYTVTQGSIIVTLKPEFLQTLPVGNHTISIVSTQGTAQGSFTVAPYTAPTQTPPSANTTSPQTGDNNLAQVAGWIFAVSVLGIAVAVIAKNYKKFPKN